MDWITKGKAKLLFGEREDLLAIISPVIITGGKYVGEHIGDLFRVYIIGGEKNELSGLDTCFTWVEEQLSIEL